MIVSFQEALLKRSVAGHACIVHGLDRAAIDRGRVGIDDLHLLGRMGLDGLRVFREVLEDAAVEH